MAKSSEGRLTAAAKAMGNVGGKKGGPARARALTATRRQEIARQGGQARRAKLKRSS